MRPIKCRAVYYALSAALPYLWAHAMRPYDANAMAYRRAGRIG